MSHSSFESYVATVIGNDPGWSGPRGGSSDRR